MEYLEVRDLDIWNISMRKFVAFQRLSDDERSCGCETKISLQQHNFDNENLFSWKTIQFASHHIFIILTFMSCALVFNLWTYLPRSLCHVSLAFCRFSSAQNEEHHTPKIKHPVTAQFTLNFESFTLRYLLLLSCWKVFKQENLIIEFRLFLLVSVRCLLSQLI